MCIAGGLEWLKQMALIVGGVTVIKPGRISVYLCVRATNENKEVTTPALSCTGAPPSPLASLVTIQSVCVYLLRLE